MITLNYIEVPHTEEADTERELHTWTGGRCVMENRTTEVQIMLFHTDETITEPSREEGAEATERDITKAWCFCVDKPITRDKAINAAEMEAYNLRSAMDVAAFAASLSRKSRTNETADEVREHDEFIDRVKDALTKIGL